MHKFVTILITNDDTNVENVNCDAMMLVSVKLKELFLQNAVGKLCIVCWI